MPGVGRVAVGDQPEDLGVEAFLHRADLDETRQTRNTGPGGTVFCGELCDVEHVFDGTDAAPPVQGAIAAIGEILQAASVANN